MKRDYESGVSDKPVLFVGYEVEKTQHYKEKTLFVASTKFTLSYIREVARSNNCTHVYLAANHIYPSGWPSKRWIYLCISLKKEFNVTLEVELKHLDDDLIYFSKIYDFILMVGCPIKDLHRNIVIKVDDVDFKASNKGVWTVRPLLDDEIHFTSWNEYKNDRVIE